MKTWINIKYIAEITKEHEFLWELYNSEVKDNKNLILNFDKFNKIKCFNYVDPKIIKVFNHNKRIKTFIFIDCRNSKHNKFYRINGCFVYAINVVDNPNSLGCYYRHIHSRITLLNNINLFSTGLYRRYKNNWYKLIDNIQFNGREYYYKYLLKYGTKKFDA